MGRANSLFFCVALFLLAGCGNTQTPRDQRRLQDREDIEKRLREIKPLVGQFEGKIVLAEKNQTRPFKLNIVISGDPKKGTNSGGQVTLPTLSAALWYYSSSSSGYYIRYDFDRSHYDPESKEVSFYSKKPEGSLQISLDPEDASRMTGTWFNSLNSMSGEIDLRRTEQSDSKISTKLFQGRFEGRIYLIKEDRYRPFKLRIVSAGEPKPVASAGGAIMPSLAATTRHYISKTSGFYTRIEFERSYFDPETWEIWLYSKDPAGSLKVELNEDDPDRIRGEWYNGFEGLTGKFEVVTEEGF